MNIFTRLKIYSETYFAERSCIPLYDLVESKAKMLMGQAPEGKEPFYVTVQPDGSAITSDIVPPGEDTPDELVLRKDMGDLYANILQKKATRTTEEISRLNLNTRDAFESRQELREKQDKLLEQTQDYYFARRESTINLYVFLAVALGEVGALFILFSDLFGLDPMKLSRELFRYPLSALFIACLTIGFFIASLLMAEQALLSKYRALWIAGLSIMAYLTAQLRAAQTAALGETELSSTLLSLIFMIIGFALPLAAAYFYINWKETRQITGLADSKAARLEEEEARIIDRLRESDMNRENAEKELEGLTEEYVRHYQKAQEDRERNMADWERHRRRTEVYLADVKLAYLFWQGWRQRREVISREVKKLLQITGALFLALALSTGAISIAHAETPFNILALCDRSSSAADYSCTAETISDLGRFWLKKADSVDGGKFELFLIGSSFDTTDLLFSITYPDHFPGPVSAHKKKWKNEFLRKLSAKLKELPSRTGSAIMEAIYRSLLRMSDTGNTVIYVLSDLREVNEAFNFERRVPSDIEFSRWLKREAIEPHFKKPASIVVCGIHPYTPDDTSRMTTQNYDQLIKLWQGIFKEWAVRASFSETCDFKTTKEE